MRALSLMTSVRLSRSMDDLDDVHLRRCVSAPVDHSAGFRSVGCQHEAFFPHGIARDLNWHARKTLNPDEPVITPPRPHVGREDEDRFNHDVANLFVLPYLIFVTDQALREIAAWEALHVGATKGYARDSLPLPPSWWWHLAAGSFMVYMALDVLWIYLRPHAVKSNNVIYCHHAVVFFGYVISYQYLEVRCPPFFARFLSLSLSIYLSIYLSCGRCARSSLMCICSHDTQQQPPPLGRVRCSRSIAHRYSAPP